MRQVKEKVFYLDWIMDISESKSLRTSAGFNIETEFAITCQKYQEPSIRRDIHNNYRCNKRKSE